MDFKTVKEFCKHAATAIKCPATYKNCIADNCPLVIEEQEEQVELEPCPCIKIQIYRDDLRRSTHELIKLQEDHKLLEKNYEDMRRQCDEVEGEFNSNIDKSIDLLTRALYDLKDKLKETAKRLEP